jgi:hypothetical protein
MCKPLYGPAYRALVAEEIREAAAIPASDVGVQWLALVAKERAGKDAATR